MSEPRTVRHAPPPSEGLTDHGFTLVEVVVTLALIAALSLIMLALASQLRSIQIAQKENDAAIELEALANALEGVIGNIRSLPLTQDNPQKRFLLRGAADKVIFVAAARVGTSAYGLRDIVITQNAEAGRLILELYPRRAEQATHPKETIILSERAAVRFWYRVKHEYSGDRSNVWSNRWTEPGAMPLAIRFEVTITRESKDLKTTRLVGLHTLTNRSW
ncbi:prepilin-type N-terminal cleavage/methylation domain-containing protein [Agrobacterium tumefaciens]|uniref:prepilin-type N-terminal cleavage/methylation domain-containing protein n=1 Tax=Agrobacterium tumefaciens TaxID=358 RepID=UPI00122FDDEC|nr:prepilin-type N-terminal cleavage/methylation domain-containing protein [Agrobacterium tumefaciens]